MFRYSPVPSHSKDLDQYASAVSDSEISSRENLITGDEDPGNLISSTHHKVQKRLLYLNIAVFCASAGRIVKSGVNLYHAGSMLLVLYATPHSVLSILFVVYKG